MNTMTKIAVLALSAALMAGCMTRAPIAIDVLGMRSRPMLVPRDGLSISIVIDCFPSAGPPGSGALAANLAFGQTCGSSHIEVKPLAARREGRK